MTKNPFMNSLSAEEGKKRVLEEYERREILLVNDNAPCRAIGILHKQINTEPLKPLKMGVREMYNLFKSLPSVKIDGFEYRILP